MISLPSSLLLSRLDPISLELSDSEFATSCESATSASANPCEPGTSVSVIPCELLTPPDSVLPAPLLHHVMLPAITMLISMATPRIKPLFIIAFIHTSSEIGLASYFITRGWLCEQKNRAFDDFKC